MKRFKSIDIFRGFSMLWMMLGHLTEWALKPEYNAYRQLLGSIFDPMGATAFLFIAGVSTMISYRKRLKKTEEVDTYNKKMLKSEYFLRASFILLIALVYNFIIALRINDLSWIWTWFILLTISFSLLISWFLLDVPNLFKLSFAFVLWIIHYFLLNFLLDFKGDTNLFGITYYILYNSMNLDPIVQMYSFFLIGLIIGDLLYNSYEVGDVDQKNQYVNKRIIIPSIIIGVILIVFGASFQFPLFFTPRTYPWLYYSLGVELIIFSILLYIENYRLGKSQNRFKFLFYYSYYSLTTYILHNVFFFLFNDMLDPINVWIYASIVIISYGMLLKYIYSIFGAKFSLKAQIGLLANNLTQRLIKS